jgi:hypothetical protein
LCPARYNSNNSWNKRKDLIEGQLKSSLQQKNSIFAKTRQALSEKKLI